MELKPLYDNIVVKMTTIEKTSGGLIIANNNAIEYDEGVVVSKGGGYRTNDGKLLPLSVNVGDSILFRKMVGVEIDKKEKLFLISEANVLAIK
jgi:chaperonin GroES